MVLPVLLLWFTILPSGLEQLLVQTVLGYQSVMEAFGRISSSTFAPGTLDFAFALVSFSPSVFGCCLWSTLYSGHVLCLVQQWVHVLREAFGELHIFSTCGALRPVVFFFLFYRMEKCAQLMLQVAASLRAVRTLNLDIISTSSPCDGVGLTHFASFFALRVERQFFEPSMVKSSSPSTAPLAN